MQASHWEFSGTESNRLRICNRSAPARRAKTARRQRQSVLAVAYTAVRRLPFCSTAAAVVVWISALLLPEHIRWTTAAWSAGLLALALAAGSAAISWRATQWALNGQVLELTYGVLTRTEVTIHRSAILSAELETTLFTGLFRCSILYIRTAQRGSRRIDQLLMSTHDGVKLCGLLMPARIGQERSTPPHCFRADKFSLILGAIGGEGLAAFLSASASVFSLFRDIIGTALGERIAILIRSRGTALTAAAIVMFFWLLKAGYSLLANAGMSLTRTERVLTLSRGIARRELHYLRLDGICSLESSFSLLSIFTGRANCRLQTSSGRHCDMLPPVKRRRLRIETAAILPRGRRVCAVQPMLSPLAYSWSRWAVCLSVLPLTSLMQRVMPSWRATVVSAGMTAATVLMLHALLHAVCAAEVGLTLYTDCAELTGVRRLSIRTLRILRPSVGMIRIVQSPFNRISGRCTVRVVPQGGRTGASLRCICLPFERTLAVCQRIM